MTVLRNLQRALLAFLAVGMVASTPAVAQQQQKPNILFIMGDDIGWMQPGIYHRGLMVGETRTPANPLRVVPLAAARCRCRRALC